LKISAALMYSGGTYAQNFDSLATSGTGNAWANDTTISGWHLFNKDSAAITTYNAGTGSSGTGNFYSFGLAASSERALGGVGSGGAYFGSPVSGAVAGWIAVAIVNNSGSTFSGFAIQYTGEQWRDGGAATPVSQTMVLEYGFGATFGDVTTWTAPGGSFDFTSPVFVNTGTGAAVDGNGAGQSTGRGGTVDTLSWDNDETLWIRWIERNDTGLDHGLAIDDLSITAVPEAAHYALFCSLGLLLIGGGHSLRSYLRRRRATSV